MVGTYSPVLTGPLRPGCPVAVGIAGHGDALSWWGKLVGGAFGFMLGGPLGALLGLGDNFDKGSRPADDAAGASGDHRTGADVSSPPRSR